MPEVHHVVKAEADLPIVWNFVKDMGNWAALMPGYQRFEQQNESDSLWIVKVDLGPFTRVLELQVHVTEWAEPTRVSFEVECANEPFIGSGAFVAEVIGAATTQLVFDFTTQGTGMAAFMVEALAKPVLNKGVKEFAGRMVESIEARMQTPA
ncbi:MAG: SRPBCC family protein [Chloroflexota bacterium]|nr:MAG: SRPBCC family protein [Chloroflexota bacterium]